MEIKNTFIVLEKDGGAWLRKVHYVSMGNSTLFAYVMEFPSGTLKKISTEKFIEMQTNFINFVEFNMES